MIYVIKDVKGNYVTQNAFQKTSNVISNNNNWLYISYTGKTTGFKMWEDITAASNIIKTLQKTNDVLGFNKGFELVLMNNKNITNGERLIEKIIM